MNPAEKLLFEYPEKRAEIGRLQGLIDTISSAHTSRLDANAAARRNGSPVESWYARIERMRAQVAALELDTAPVDRLMRGLPDDLRDLLRLHYFRGVPWRKVWPMRNRMTVWRKRKRLAMLINQSLGGDSLKNQ
jgi:hypothetical protein